MWAEREGERLGALEVAVRREHQQDGGEAVKQVDEAVEIEAGGRRLRSR